MQRDVSNTNSPGQTKIGNVQGQWQLINSNITIIDKSRTWTTVSPKKSSRQNSWVFRLDGKEICKVMFLNTLAITDKSHAKSY